MLSIEELERKWLIYKVKTYIPHAVIAVSLIVISIIIFIVSGSKTSQPTTNNTQVQKQAVVVTSSKEKNTSLPNNVSNDTHQKESSNIKTPKEKKVELDKVVIFPSFNFMQEIEKETKERAIKKPLPKKKTTPKKTYTKKKNESVPVVEEEKKKIIINIGKEDTQKEIQDVIRRFKKTNSPVLSLFIAKKYYEAGNYTMAYNYALITNGIDSEIEKSWLIFAKSLVKLNKKDKAIQTLQEYINHSRSSRAQTLLDEIISGKMK